MIEIAWTALALLAAAVFGMFGMFFYLGQKIDGLDASLSSRIDATNSRIDALDASLGSRIDALSSRLDAHIERHAS